MFRTNYFFGILFFGVLVITLSSLTSSQPGSDQSQTDSLARDREKYLVPLRAQIKGKEKLPADSVFKNIRSMKGVPAGRLLAIMDVAYSQSLGVSCGHCHTTASWESEEKPQKQIAREMALFMGKTREMLKEIKGLKSENPTINCTTCHRGSIKPALDLTSK